MAEAGRWQAEGMPRLPEAATCEEQLNLNMDSYSPQPVEQDMVSLPEMTDWERMAADYSILSLSPHYHPMALIRSHLHEGIVSTAHLEHLPDGAKVEVAGLVVCRQRPGTAKGFVFLLLEDESGMANVVIKPQL